MMNVMNGFTKPQTNLYRTFLHLDGGSVINCLSGLEGGDIDEVLTRVASEAGRDLGGELDAKVVCGKASRKKAERYEEEMRRKRTEHSAAIALLRKLHDAGAVGIIHGSYGPAIHADLAEQMTLEIKAELLIHPLHQVVAAARELARVGPTFGFAKTELREVSQVADMLETMSQGGPGSGRTFLAYATTEGQSEEYRLVLPIQSRHLLVPLEEFAGRATVVAQVDRILGQGDEVMVMRLLRNAPPLPMERQGIADAVPEFVEAMRELGVRVAISDFALTYPTVILRPICIFK